MCTIFAGVYVAAVALFLNGGGGGNYASNALILPEILQCGITTHRALQLVFS